MSSDFLFFSQIFLSLNKAKSKKETEKRAVSNFMDK